MGKQENLSKANIKATDQQLVPISAKKKKNQGKKRGIKPT
jgi:hypothetical protein